MKRSILTVAAILASTTVAAADGFWVVGNPSTGKCDIVTSNPVISGASPSAGGTGYSFGDGPYNSKDDAKLARSTIKTCPQEPEPPASK